MEENYEFTDLAGNDELIKDIRSLEHKIEQKIGDKVNLIAYSPVEDLVIDPNENASNGSYIGSLPK
jgi:hypothetical protein